MMIDILREAEEIENEMISYRRKIHKNPECGFDLDETMLTISDYLLDCGYVPQKCGRCGIIAIVGEGESTVLLRADCDALYINEETDLPFASKNGKMHACGHDIHTVMLMGAAKILKKYQEKLKNRVVLMFQGAEEILEGAKDMIDNGLLSVGRPTRAFMLHTVLGTSYEVGSLIVPPEGEISPYAEFFKIDVHGYSSHGAEPEKGIDAIYFGAKLINELYLSFSKLKEVVFSVGRADGGASANVISDAFIIEGTFRYFDKYKRNEYIELIKQIINDVKNKNKCEILFEIKASCPAFLNNAEFLKSCTKNVAELLGGDRVHLSQAKGGGSEDFAYVSREVPSVMLAICAGSEMDGCNYPLHNSKSLFSEEVIKYGIAVYTCIGMK